MNINWKVVALGRDITISFETPAAISEHEARRAAAASSTAKDGPMDGKRRKSRTSVAGDDESHLCAMLLRAELNMMDIFEDSRAVEEIMRVAAERAASQSKQKKEKADSVTREREDIGTV